MQRTSKMNLRYAGRDIAAGATFDVHPNHIRILIALGRIEPAEGDHGYVAKPIAAQHQFVATPLTKGDDESIEQEFAAPVPPAQAEPVAEVPEMVPSPVAATAPAPKNAATKQPAKQVKAAPKKAKSAKKAA